MFGAAGSTVVIEEMLTGEEVSVSSIVFFNLKKGERHIFHPGKTFLL